MICEGCGCVFCWDGADEGAAHGYRRRYCSASCEQRASCSQRRKLRYANASAAARIAEQSLNLHGKQLHPYECACGWWHLSKRLPVRE